MLHLIYSYVRAQVRQHEGILTLVQNMQTLGQLFEPLYTEGMILHILEQHHIEGVPMLVSEQQAKTSLCDPKHLDMLVNCSTHILHSALSQGFDFKLRTLCCLVSRPIGKLILDFRSLRELLVGYLDHVVGK